MCGISFRTREFLKQHQEREHNECPRFACETCGMRFGNNYHLRRHEVIHTNEELPCPLCSRRFKRKDGLDTHMSHIHGVSNQDYSTQIMENTYAKSPLQDTPSDIGEEDNNEKSFTELISYDSLYTQKEFLGTENPFITPSALSVEQFGEENYFSDETMELKVKSQSILSQLESLSQYKPTSTLVQSSEPEGFSLEHLQEGDTYDELATCVPVLEPHMSTPLDNMEQLYHHEIPSTEAPDSQSVRQSVIRIKKNIK